MADSQDIGFEINQKRAICPYMATEFINFHQNSKRTDSSFVVILHNMFTSCIPHLINQNC